MPIVINEFEIIVEPPQQTAHQAPDASADPASLSPEEITAVMKVQEERLQRVRAD